MKPRRNHDPGRVRRKRIEAGLQQQELAHQAGISRPHMSSIEHGRVSPSPGVLRRMAEVLGCEVTELMPPDSSVDEQSGSAA